MTPGVVIGLAAAVLILVVLSIAIWKMPTVRMASQSLFDPEDASPSAVLADLERYQHRRVCFLGTVTKAVPFTGPSEDEPLSYLFDGMDGSLTLQGEDDVIVDVLLQSPLDAATPVAGTAPALPGIGTTIRVCGFASASPAVNADKSPRIMLVGRLSPPGRAEPPALQNTSAIQARAMPAKGEPSNER